MAYNFGNYNKHITKNPLKKKFVKRLNNNICKTILVLLEQSHNILSEDKYGGVSQKGK